LTLIDCLEFRSLEASEEQRACGVNDPVGGPTSQREMDDCKGKMVAGAGGR